MPPSIPTYHGPAFVGALFMLAGGALVYWSLLGWGVISGTTPEERKASLIEKVKGTTP